MTDEKLIEFVRRELKAKKERNGRFETLKERARREKLVKIIISKLGIQYESQV